MKTPVVISLALTVFLVTDWLPAAAPQEIASNQAAAPITGPFEPTWESLANYEFPEWFRDAKFGIWAHWSAQSQAENNDWYARNMYIERSAGMRFGQDVLTQGPNQYRFHLDHYGHPSKVGFKDVIHQWKAENFDPDSLLGFYKQCGAKYFMALANHHENFDNFNSKFQPWNSVNVGPKKDLIGMWSAAARKHGLRFGVSVHASHAWSWYETAQGADKEGPYAGVPYDGKLTKADGKGQWWEGLDPQDLYAQNHAPNPHNRIEWSWDPAKGCSVPDAAYMEKFYNRCVQLWDDYQPDQIYFDDFVMPFHEIDPEFGLKLAAHFYNNSMANHGRNEAVMNTKFLDKSQRKALVLDMERSKAGDILPEPWQTDTCIGYWHYDRNVYYQRGYKGASVVVPMLIDIVSKNGNLMLSVPVRGDGTIDREEEKIVTDIGNWLRVNGEAIYATRPWKIYGEGPSTKRSGRGHGVQHDAAAGPFSDEEIRFTRSKDNSTLYAIALAWPADGEITVRTLAADAPGIEGDVTGVDLFGSSEKLEFKRDATGLVVTMPAQKPCEHAFALKIKGLDLAASDPSVTAAEKADAQGTILLGASSASVHGNQLFTQGEGENCNLGFWNDASDWASWKFSTPKAGRYVVSARVATAEAGNVFTVEVGEQKFTNTAPQTGSWDNYVDMKIGVLEVKEAGELTLAIRPAGDPSDWKAINLASVVLKPVKQ